MQAIFPAPAKLNLFLHIVGRKPNGYHELQTVFQLLDFGDVLRFIPRQDSAIYLQTDLNFPPEKNLVWQAAKKLQVHTNTHLGIDIYLEKRISMGAGLGGGSSDAATTLIALNILWETKLPIDTLAEIGQQLGADVPVFVRGQTSWAEGIGERLTPMICPENWYVVLVPSCAITTAEIFAHPQLTRDTPPIKMADFFTNPHQLHNDFEPLVRKIYPPVAEALDWLAQFNPLDGPRLTGSGSAVFAAFSERTIAKQVFSQKPAFIQGFVAKGMNRSPLFFELDKMQKQT